MRQVAWLTHALLFSLVIVGCSSTDESAGPGGALDSGHDIGMPWDALVDRSTGGDVGPPPDASGDLGPGDSGDAGRPDSGDVGLVDSGPPDVLVDDAYFVAKHDPGGCDDSWSGDEGHPWCSINHAVSQLQPGETCYVKNGVYAEMVRDFEASGTAGNPISLRVFPGHTATIEITGARRGISMVEKDYWTVDGFDIDLKDELAYGIDLFGVQHTIFENIRIDGNGVATHGIKVRAYTETRRPAMDNLFRNIVIHGMGSGPAEGVYLGFWVTSWPPAGSPDVRNTFDNVEVYDCTEGIDIKPGADDVAISNSHIHDNAEEGIILGATGTVYGNRIHDNGHGLGTQPGIRVTDRSWVYNNLVYRNASGGIVNDMFSCTQYPNELSCNGNRIYHNTVVDNGSFGISSGNGTHDIRNNLVYGHDSGDNIDDPGFVDAGAFDFHLQDTSSAVDACGDVGIDVDFDGTSRPQGPAFDLGAYEIP